MKRLALSGYSRGILVSSRVKRAVDRNNVLLALLSDPDMESASALQDLCNDGEVTYTQTILGG
ncbi:hypothetical protein GCM10022231_36740 [Gordonia caeni]|uniref:Uncharacterized protein n=1 Tax=Gordonia caeni TaxID=1007097 RepID=A0ABP7PWM7_9ACTN